MNRLRASEASRKKGILNLIKKQLIFICLFCGLAEMRGPPESEALGRFPHSPQVRNGSDPKY